MMKIRLLLKELQINYYKYRLLRTVRFVRSNAHHCNDCDSITITKNILVIFLGKVSKKDAWFVGCIGKPIICEYCGKTVWGLIVWEDGTQEHNFISKQYSILSERAQL